MNELSVPARIMKHYGYFWVHFSSCLCRLKPSAGSGPVTHHFRVLKFQPKMRNSPAACLNPSLILDPDSPGLRGKSFRQSSNRHGHGVISPLCCSALGPASRLTGGGGWVCDPVGWGTVPSIKEGESGPASSLAPLRAPRLPWASLREEGRAAPQVLEVGGALRAQEFPHPYDLPQKLPLPGHGKTS